MSDPSPHARSSPGRQQCRARPPVFDRTVIPIDRVAADRLSYSGRHRRHEMNLQVIARPDSDIRAGCPARRRLAPRPAKRRQVLLPVVTSPRRDAALITRWHDTIDLPWPPRQFEAPDIRRAGCPEGRRDQRRQAGDRGNHRQDDPRRSSKQPRGRHPCPEPAHDLADH